MRPKKVIVYLDSNEVRRGMRTFILRTKGFRVIEARTVEAALGLISQEGQVDLFLTAIPKFSKAMVQSVKGLDPLIQIFAIGKVWEDAIPDFHLSDENCTSAVLLYWAHQLCARKRGPRKQVPEKVQVSA